MSCLDTVNDAYSDNIAIEIAELQEDIILPELPKEKVDIKKLQDQFSASTQMTNLEFVSSALKLRKALIEDGKPDPFLLFVRRISPTEDDIRKANKVADAFEYCVDAAQGDPAIFNMELMRITRDS